MKIKKAGPLRVLCNTKTVKKECKYFNNRAYRYRTSHLNAMA